VLTKLFSNVALAPAAAYFLMIFANPGNSIDWAATNSPVTTLGQGVFLNQLTSGSGEAAFNNSFAPYPPATLGIGIQEWLILDVEAVPEPGNFCMVLGALVGATILKTAAGRRVEQNRAVFPIFR
jgi:hypothetical protein